jgi:hypothetical protein
MNCRQAREEILLGAASPAADAHVRGCAECAAELAALRQTMSVLEEWPAPEPSPYFDARLRSRLRAEAQRPATWREWLAAAASPFTHVGRRFALATTTAVLLAAGVTLYQVSPTVRPVNDTRVEAQAQPGTPVADLQALDKNHDLLAGLDLLDEEGEITP